MRTDEIDVAELLRMLWDVHGEVPQELMSAVVMEALATASPWTVGETVGLPWLSVALIQMEVARTDIPDFGVNVELFTCTCGRTLTSAGGFTRHMARCHEHNMEAEKMSEAFPTHPSNKTVIEQVTLWGGEITKKKGNVWQVTMPNGDRFSLMAPTYHDGNKAEVFTAIYRSLGVTPNVFWEKQPEPEQVDEAPAAPPVSRGQSTMVLDILIGQGRPMTSRAVAEMTGLTALQVGRAMYYLANLDPPLVKRVKSGIYEATTTRPPDHLVGIDVKVDNGGSHAPAQTPQEAPEAPAAAPVPLATLKPVSKPPAATQPPADDESLDRLIIDFLDMVFPSGFSARHLMAIDRWRAATKDLFREMGE